MLFAWLKDDDDDDDDDDDYSNIYHSGQINVF